MFRPRQGNEHTHVRGSALIEKPARRQMIDAHHVETDLPHLREIASDLFRISQVIAFRIRFKGPIGNPLHKKFPVALEEKFRDRANATERRGILICHSEQNEAKRSGVEESLIIFLAGLEQ